ncbi:uncharacterized protein LOC143285251 [Babylonia areolata]|uniref:uncharacterized protein LOC143285251 n=1 Tax=Babylonia areolata TaxID=304850 RepID=UPI003FD41BD1
MDLLLLLTGWLVLRSVTSEAVASSSTSGLRFIRDPNFDDRKVTNDADRLDLSGMATLTTCTSMCARHEWCSSFFYNVDTRDCSLYATAFVGPDFAESSVGSRYYRQTEAWCPVTAAGVLYNRPAEMCVYIEATTQVPTLDEADDACVSRNMRLIHDISPTRMTALKNFTMKNKVIYNQSIYIGLKRSAPGASTFEWIDGQPLNTADLAPFWENNQPNGAAYGQDCVVVRASVDSTLNDVTCNVDHTRKTYIARRQKPSANDCVVVAHEDSDLQLISACLSKTKVFHQPTPTMNRHASRMTNNETCSRLCTSRLHLQSDLLVHQWIAEPPGDAYSICRAKNLLRPHQEHLQRPHQ